MSIILKDTRTGIVTATDLVEPQLGLYLRENPDIVKVGIATTANANYYPLLNEDTINRKDPYVSSNFYYNPRTNTLSLGSVSISTYISGISSLSLTGPFYDSVGSKGASGQILSSTGNATAWINASTTNAGSATSVGINLDSTNTTRYITFTDRTSGNGYIQVDTDITYNPSTNILTGINLNFGGSGTITNLSGTNINYSGIGTIANISGTNINYSGIGTISITALNSTIGSITNLTGTNINYSGIGTISTLSGTTLTYPTANITVGLVTNLSGTNLNYSGIGTITTLGSTNGTVTNLTGTAATITNLNGTVGSITNLSGSNANFSGVGTISTLSGTTLTYPTAYHTVGIITTLTGTNISYSGVSTISNLQSTSINVSGASTIGNVTIGAGNTTLIVQGNARITGILTVGTGSVTINGNNNNITGVSTINLNSAVSGNIVFNDGSIQSSLYTLIPQGSVVTFYQASAPTGWTQVTTHNDKALRVVSGTGGGSGGSTAFTSVFTSRTPAGTVSGTNSSGSVSATTLDISQIPSHRHSATFYYGDYPYSYDSSIGSGPLNDYSGNLYTGYTGGSGSHTHGFTNPTWSGSFAGSSMNFAVQYVDIIIASRN